MRFVKLIAMFGIGQFVGRNGIFYITQSLAPPTRLKSNDYTFCGQRRVQFLNYFPQFGVVLQRRPGATWSRDFRPPTSTVDDERRAFCQMRRVRVQWCVTTSLDRTGQQRDHVTIVRVRFQIDEWPQLLRLLFLQNCWRWSTLTSMGHRRRLLKTSRNYSSTHVLWSPRCPVLTSADGSFCLFSRRSRILSDESWLFFHSLTRSKLSTEQLIVTENILMISKRFQQDRK